MIRLLGGTANSEPVHTIFSTHKIPIYLIFVSKYWSLRSVCNVMLVHFNDDQSNSRRRWPCLRLVDNYKPICNSTRVPAILPGTLHFSPPNQSTSLQFKKLSKRITSLDTGADEVRAATLHKKLVWKLMHGYIKHANIMNSWEGVTESPQWTCITVPSTFRSSRHCQEKSVADKTTQTRLLTLKMPTINPGKLSHLCGVEHTGTSTCVLAEGWGIRGNASTCSLTCFRISTTLQWLFGCGPVPIDVPAPSVISISDLRSVVV